MNDIQPGLPSPNNIKGLVQDLTEQLDARMAELRVGTPFESVRPSDVKTFMLVARHPRTVSDVARALSVSRQAIHGSVRRLMKRGMIELQPAPGSRRDKIAAVTEEGHVARREVARNLGILESELKSRIGSERLEILRSILVELTTGPQDGDSQRQRSR